jgi:hypothetical protein
MAGAGGAASDVRLNPFPRILGPQAQITKSPRPANPPVQARGACAASLCNRGSGCRSRRALQQ